MDLSTIQSMRLYPGAVWVHAIGGIPWLASNALALASMSWLLAMFIFRRNLYAKSYKSEQRICILGQVAAALLVVLALFFSIHEMALFNHNGQSAFWPQRAAEYALLAVITCFAPQAIAVGALEIVRRKFKAIEAKIGA
jgi:hypothetical protein